ncbi:hypothetical protein [Methylobacterium aquaticum]|jgi:hypothetical protein|uniref:OmpR/PhoB-type domain-containing protein n=1 Tax=Methylobacterium aquaticum TaxID=270351 RepID=A0A0J6S4P1_9HYPH|nr:hypothetical protein [Methylobacterium aquaticum]KMO28552.1 hypothetical protein VP06_27135 [Methylobacterium aquaticum]
MQSTTPLRGPISAEARARRREIALETPRGPLPAIIVADRGGWEIALDRPDAVVLDLHADCIRRGTTRVHLTGRILPTLIRFALTRLAEGDATRADLIAVVWADRRQPDPEAIGSVLSRASAALRPVGLRIISLWGGTVRLVASQRSLS